MISAPRAVALWIFAVDNLRSFNTITDYESNNNISDGRTDGNVSITSCSYFLGRTSLKTVAAEMCGSWNFESASALPAAVLNANVVDKLTTHSHGVVVPVSCLTRPTYVCIR